MRRFKKNSAVRIVIVPPHGRVHEGDILEGDEYAAYAPMFLTEISPDGSAVVTPAVAGLAEAAPMSVTVEAPAVVMPVLPTEPATADAAEVDSAESPEEATLSDEHTPLKKKGGRPRKQA